MNGGDVGDNFEGDSRNVVAGRVRCGGVTGELDFVGVVGGVCLGRVFCSLQFLLQTSAAEMTVSMVYDEIPF
jgi:hypothetical protein